MEDKTKPGKDWVKLVSHMKIDGVSQAATTRMVIMLGKASPQDGKYTIPVGTGGKKFTLSLPAEDVHVDKSSILRPVIHVDPEVITQIQQQYAEILAKRTDPGMGKVGKVSTRGNRPSRGDDVPGR